MSAEADAAPSDAIAAAAERAVASGALNPEEAQRAAYSLRRQREALAIERGELRMERVDEAAQASEAETAFWAAPADAAAYTFRLDSADDTQEARTAALAMGLPPDVANAIIGRVRWGLAQRAGRASDPDALAGDAAAARARLVARYGETEAATRIAEARALLRRAGEAESWILEALEQSGMGNDPGVVFSLSDTYRAQQRRGGK